jgi:hypothetical protein
MDYPKWQDLMNQFYDMWKSSEWQGKPQRELLEEVDQKVRDAVVLGNWNYQVENGGVRQWADNGYVLSIDYLMEALTRINTPNTKKILEFLKTLEGKVDYDSKDRGFGGSYWIEEYEEDLETCSDCGGSGYYDEEYDEDEDEYIEVECSECNGSGYVWVDNWNSNSPSNIDDFDSTYYEMEKEFHKEVNNYLIGE